MDMYEKSTKTIFEEIQQGVGKKFFLEKRIMIIGTNPVCTNVYISMLCLQTHAA
jgi:malate/lactate dehydrogenase